MNRLGIYLLETNVSKNEQKRIKDLLSIDSELYADLYQCALKGSYVRKIIKKIIKLSGFRIGSDAYFKTAVDKVFKSLLGGTADYKYWDIYKLSVAEYIDDRFNKLLYDTECEGDEDSAGILAKICEQSLNYEVTKKDIERFYNLMPLERVDNIDQILSLCKDPDPKELIKKEISIVEENLDSKIKSISKKLSNKIDVKIAEKEIDQSQLDEIEKKISDSSADLKNKFDDLQKDQIDLQKDLIKNNSEISVLSQGIINLESQVKNLGPDKELKVLTKDLKEVSKEVNKISKSFETLNIGIQKEVNNALRESESKIRGECKELISANIGTNLDSSGINSNYVSPLVKKRRISVAPESNILKEEKFVAIFYHKLLDLDETYSFASACLFHAILKTGQCVVVEDEEIILAWLDTLGWGRNSIDIPASPAWHSEKDWQYGATHLFVDTDQIPKVLFIYDYDIGLVEGYLLPTLRVWRARGFHPRLAKLYLVPANTIGGIENERLLESACYLSASVCQSIKTDSVTLNGNWQRQEDSVVRHHDEEDTGVSVDVFKSWTGSPLTSDKTNDCSKYQDLGRALNMEITLAVIDQYHDYKFAFNEFVSHEESHDRAFRLSLGPWITKTYDELMADSLEEQIKSLSLQ